MRLVNVETFKLEEFLGEVVPQYAILSHTWESDEEEVSFRDIERGDMDKAGYWPTKFEGCCQKAKKHGIKYVWIDTCCIDKTNSVELGEAINSMFQWYRKASICYAYLSDVPTGDNPHDPGSKFFSSRWFQRGWTLQELLAPKQVSFYNLAWTFLGTKSEMSITIQKITGIPRPFLLGWAALHEASVAQRMSWAATRVTKRKEDIAYCLLGIFGIMMPMIYGEGDQAFGRLQQEIMKDTRDDSILAWGLNPAKSLLRNSKDVVSGGVLATVPSDFEDCGHIVSREQYTTLVNIFDISGGCLRAHVSLHTTSAGEIYGLLNCGPEQDVEQVVGIPLNYAISGRPSDEYVRPQGRHPVLFPKTTSSASTNPIHIWKERQSRAHVATSRRYWFYIEESIETNLKMIDVQPRARWQKDRAMIATANDLNKNITQRSLARFRTRGEGSCDIVVVLELEVQELRVQARCHVMTSSRDTALEDLSQKLIYMRPEAFGKQSATNGIRNVYVTVRQESVAGQPMFVVRLAAMRSLPEVTVDATLELQQLDLKLEFVGILQNEDKTYREAEQLGQQKEEKVAVLEPMKGQLAVVEEKLRKLNEEKRLLISGLEKGAQEVHQFTIRDNEIRQRQNKLSERRLEIQQRLDELLENSFSMNGDPENWFEAIAKMLLNAGKVNFNLKDIGDSDSDSDCTQLSRAAENEHNIYDKTSLLRAATNGREAFVKLLLEGDFKIESMSRYETPVGWAAEQGYEAVVQLLMEMGEELEVKDKHGLTPLFYAALRGHEGVVKLLLEKGAELNAKNKNGLTSLSYAAYDGREAVVKLLLDKGAELEAKSKDGWTPLFYATFGGHKGVVKLLLEKGAEPEAKDKDGRTPLSLAACEGHEAVVKLLLEKGAELKAKDKDSLTPLSFAASRGYEAVVKLLLEKGAELEAKDKDGWTSLLFAASRGHEAVVKLLLEKGAELEAKDKDGQTPLSFAASRGHKVVVKLLLEKGAELEAKDKDGQTPLSFAASRGHEAVVKLLLEKGAELEAKNKNGLTPLSLAASRGHEAVVKLLLEKGAELEAKDKDGWTLLSYSAYKGHEAVVKLLLEKGTELEAKYKNGSTLLLLAALRGHEAVVKLLLEKGAELEAKDEDDRTPLSLAACEGHKAVVKLLLEKGAEPEAKDKNGWTPLSLAAYEGREAVVKLLLKKGTELEAKDKNDLTPLSLAAFRGHKAVVKLLLEKGAEPEAKDKDGRTPLSFAAHNGHGAVVKLLLERGAKRPPIIS